MPFIAKYDDYGGGEDACGIALDDIIDGIKLDLIEMEVGENQYHDLAVVREDFDVDNFFTLCSRDRLKVRGWTRNPRPVYFAMIRKDVVDALWTDWEMEVFKGKGLGNSPCGYYLQGLTFASMAAELPDFLEKVIKANNKMQKCNWLIQTDDEWGKERYEVEKYFRRIDDHMGKWQMVEISELCKNLVNLGAKDKAIELLETVLVGSLVGSMMSRTRQIWLPAMHMGSQSEEYDAYRALAKCTEDVIVKRLADYDE